MEDSLAVKLAQLPPGARQRVMEGLPVDEVERLLHDWRFWARPNQLEPGGDWTYWLVSAGRGWGKTRTGAEWVHEKVESGEYGRFHLVGPTSGDVRDVMVEGPSGIMETAKPWNEPKYSPTNRKITWPNGARAILFAAEEPERLRGPQCDAAWCDELAAWRYEEAWNQLTFGLRLGKNPRVCITTTPKPTPLVIRLYHDQKTVVTQGTTYENLANLAATFGSEIVSQYEGTRMGRQELLAELLMDSPGAMWNRDGLDEDRVRQEDLPQMQRIVVAVDPAGSVGEKSDETGIIVAGLGKNDHGYVLDDLSGKYKPADWARRVLGAYDFWGADRIVAEKNQGGDMVEATLRALDPNVSYRSVTAMKSKTVRAEPVAALYEQHKVHHVGILNTLEDQLCVWEQGMDSPDRLDALVYALTDLMVGRRSAIAVPMADLSMNRQSYWRTVGA